MFHHRQYITTTENAVNPPNLLLKARPKKKHQKYQSNECKLSYDDKIN